MKIIKNISYGLFLLLAACMALAGENLSLSCNGNLINQMEKKGGDFEVFEHPNSTQSFFFKNGVLQKEIGNLNCKWSEEEIICLEFGKKFTKDTTITRTVNINRITGEVQSIQSGHKQDGKAFSVLEFTGICKSESKKF
jgi:hypothetical protein